MSFATDRAIVPMSSAIELTAVGRLRHIEGHSPERVHWLRQKIHGEGVWTRPLAIDDRHGLVMDGQHRLEVARSLDLRWVPVICFRYADVRIRSLRPSIRFDWQTVVARALAGDIYPYKTVKHDFGLELPGCRIPLRELREGA